MENACLDFLFMEKALNSRTLWLFHDCYVPFHEVEAECTCSAMDDDAHHVLGLCAGATWTDFSRQPPQL